MLCHSVVDGVCNGRGVVDECRKVDIDGKQYTEGGRTCIYVNAKFLAKGTEYE